ncbi:hypothetical protein [Nocardia sp. XZ_19_385]|uniref:hypothetical protein n=1 Tax=Nocardia sp. XZ_19_385 TaxID=2769488 RepID=UPI00188F7382|nr:hypothetical protein [Nocardia sp. XZ_19_385]
MLDTDIATWSKRALVLLTAALVAPVALASAAPPSKPQLKIMDDQPSCNVKALPVGAPDRKQAILTATIRTVFGSGLGQAGDRVTVKAGAGTAAVKASGGKTLKGRFLDTTQTAILFPHGQLGDQWSKKSGIYGMPVGYVNLAVAAPVTLDGPDQQLEQGASTGSVDISVRNERTGATATTTVALDRCNVLQAVKASPDSPVLYLDDPDYSRCDLIGDPKAKDVVSVWLHDKVESNGWKSGAPVRLELTGKITVTYSNGDTLDGALSPAAFDAAAWSVPPDSKNHHGMLGQQSGGLHLTSAGQMAVDPKRDMKQVAVTTTLTGTRSGNPKQTATTSKTMTCQRHPYMSD